MDTVETIYRVEQGGDGPGRVRVALVRVRERQSAHRLRHQTEEMERTTLFSRSFSAMLDQVAMASYTAHMELVARYAHEGTFGCFAETRSDAGSVEVILYERWFDGDEIHTDELVRHAFDATDEQSLVASAEFLADVRVWAERRNAEREAAYLQELAADDTRRQMALDREAASRELSQILAPHTQGG